MECSFGTLKDGLIKDKVVSGINNTQVKDRLLREENLTLERCTQLCRAAELASQQIEVLKRSEAVDAIQRKTYQRTRITAKKQNEEQQRRAEGGETSNSTQTQYSVCSRCSYKHAPRSCPAYGKQCNNCKKLNHFAKVCKSQRNISVVENEEEEEIFRLGNININGIVKNRWEEEVKCLETGKTLKLKLDTGAECNVMGKRDYAKLEVKRKLHKTDVKLTNYNGTEISVRGVIKLNCQIKNKVENIEIYVVNSNRTIPVLGLPTIKKFGLITRIDNVEITDTKLEQMLKDYKEVFEGIGKVSQVYDFTVKKDYKGKVVPCRKVPFKLQEAYRSELLSMERDGIITKVEEPPEFVNPVVILRKPDKTLLVCLDPQYLNTCLLREHFKMPTFEEISSRMASPRSFSILDASKAFWQVQLNEKSSLMTTFQTPFGRYRFLRMPYGIKTAPEIFHKVYTAIFKDIPNIEIYIDDIIVWLKTRRSIKRSYS